ncbi:hypothetical protein MMC13_006247 [Lambiella insularis]|nr:hypothetical protein [Lambiella insularis]
MSDLNVALKDLSIKDISSLLAIDMHSLTSGVFTSSDIEEDLDSFLKVTPRVAQCLTPSQRCLRQALSFNSLNSDVILSRKLMISTRPPQLESNEERRLLEIAVTCKMLAGDILNRLEALKVQGAPSMWKSVQQAFKSLWTKEELSALTKKLKAHVLELNIQTVDLTYYVTTSGFYRLDQSAQRIAELLLLNRDIFTSQQDLQTKELKGIIINEQAQTRAMILDLVQRKGISQATSASYVQSTELSAEAVNLGIDQTDRAIRKWLLDSLGFSTMQNCAEEVAEAYNTTFEWIFEKLGQEAGQLPWTKFVY